MRRRLGSSRIGIVISLWLLVASQAAAAVPTSQQEMTARFQSAVALLQAGDMEGCYAALLDCYAYVEPLPGTKGVFEGTLLFMIGKAEIVLGDAEKAEATLYLAKATVDPLGPEGHDIRSKVLSALGEVEYAKGNYEQAQQLLTTAIETAEERPDADPSSLCSALASLARFQREMGDLEASEINFERAVALWEAAPPIGGPEPYLLVCGGLSRLYGYQARFAEAEALVQRGLDQQVTLAPHSVIVRNELLSNQALIFMFQGNFTEATPLLEEIVEAFEAGQGDASAMTSLNQLLLGMCYGVTDRLDEAEALMDAAEASRLTLFGPEHPEYGWALLFRSVLLFAQGDVDGSIELETEAHRIIGPYQSEQNIMLDALRESIGARDAAATSETQQDE